MNDVPGIAYLKEGENDYQSANGKIDLRELPSPYRFEEDLPHLCKTSYLY